MTTEEWIGIAGVAVAAATLFPAAIALWGQARSADFSTYLQLQATHADAWRRYRDASEEAKEFELIEVLNILEASCHLYRKKRLSGASKDMVEEYLKDTIPHLVKHEAVLALMRRAKVSPRTYEHIAAFCKKHRIDYAL